MKSVKSVESKSQWKNEVDRLEEIKSKLEDESSKIVIAHHKDCEGKKNMRRNGIIMKYIGGILFIIFILAFVVALCIIRFNVQPSILGWIGLGLLIVIGSTIAEAAKGMSES